MAKFKRNTCIKMFIQQPIKSLCTRSVRFIFNRIQNKCFCLHNKCICNVFIYYVYINTHTHTVYILKIFTCIRIYIIIFYIICKYILHINITFFLKYIHNKYTQYTHISCKQKCLFWMRSIVINCLTVQFVYVFKIKTSLTLTQAAFI